MYLTAFNLSNLALLVFLELTILEVLDYGIHPVVDRGRSIDSLGLICRMYARLVKEFYRDDLQELSIFGGCQVG